MAETTTAAEAPMDAKAIAEAREKMRARLGAQQVGKKGTVRIAPRVSAQVEKGEAEKVKAALKKLSMQQIGPVEEVILNREDGLAYHFRNPKVAIDPRSSVTSITGTFELKKGEDSFMTKIKETAFKQQQLPAVEDDDAIPDLVEDFEAIADDKKVDEID